MLNGWYKKVLDRMPQGVFVFDDKLRVKFTNAAFRRYFPDRAKPKGALFNVLACDKSETCGAGEACNYCTFYRAMTAAIKEKSEKEKNPSLLDKITFIKEILAVFLKAFSRYLKVNIKKLHIVIATPDAAQTAITYGAVSGVIAGIVELIDSYTNLKSLKKNAIIVEPDFTSEKSDVNVNITLSISVFGALVTLAKTFWKSILLKNKQ